MRIGVISDTHGDTAAIRRAVAQVGAVDAWLHGGDYFADGAVLARLTGLPVTVVAGNCDGRGAGPHDAFPVFGGVKIWLTHGHHYGVKHGLNELLRQARQYGVSVVVFGHTHRPLVTRQDGVLLLNPGSAALPREREATCGLLTLTADGAAAAEIVTLPWPSRRSWW